MERCWTCHGQGWYANRDGATIGCVYCKGSGVKWEKGEVYQRIAKLERERDALLYAINGMPCYLNHAPEQVHLCAACRVKELIKSLYTYYSNVQAGQTERKG